MKRSKTVTTVLLLSSLSLFLAACDDEDKTAGMKFESYEECALNIGPDNCQKAATNQKVVTQSSTGASTSTFMPIFLPMPGYGGGYLHDAPRAQSNYVPRNPVFSSNPSRVPSTGPSISPSSSSAAARSSYTAPSSSASRGGFGSTSSSFSSSS